jgi:hypothetical protein
MGKITEVQPHPDDPIYSEGPRSFFPRSALWSRKSKTATPPATDGHQPKPSASEDDLKDHSAR